MISHASKCVRKKQRWIEREAMIFVVLYDFQSERERRRTRERKNNLAKKS